MFNLIMITFMIRLENDNVNSIFINVFVQLQNQLITQYIQEEEWLKSDIMTMIPNFLQKYRNSKIHIQRDVEDIISSYSLTDFQRHFRLSKSCFEIVLDELENVIINHEKVISCSSSAIFVVTNRKLLPR